jgi:hypothetical protein
MTTKCANPGCNHPFLYFRSGKIYLIDLAISNVGSRTAQPSRGMEYFWLCGDCAQTMRVGLDRQGTVVVERVPDSVDQPEPPRPPQPLKKATMVSAA